MESKRDKGYTKPGFEVTKPFCPELVAYFFYFYNFNTGIKCELLAILSILILFYTHSVALLFSCLPIRDTSKLLCKHD